MTSTTPQAAEDTPLAGSFEADVRAALHGVRGALADLVDAVGADPGKSQDMARQLGLNKNLTWRISKVVCEPDPFSAIPHLPGKSGLNIFLKSLRSAGATREAVERANQAFSRFEAMVELHSGDRETLQMMLGDLARVGQREREESHRKLAFKGNSATWGVQARVQLCVNAIAPSEHEGMADLAWLSGLIDFRRLRQDARWAMASARLVQDDGTPIDTPAIEAIDPRFTSLDTAPLLGDFCSQPLPDVDVTKSRDGMIRYELGEGPVGNTASLSCIIGLSGRGFVRRSRVENDTLGEHAARLYTPVETLVHDIFVHRDLDYAMDPGIYLYSQMPGGPIYPASGREAGRLPLFETLQEVGQPGNAVSPDIPNYRQILTSVFTNLKWKSSEFRGFRLVMRYPPIPALAVFRYELP